MAYFGLEEYVEILFCTVLSWLAFEQQQFKANSLQLLHQIQQTNDLVFAFNESKKNISKIFVLGGNLLLPIQSNMITTMINGLVPLVLNNLKLI